MRAICLLLDIARHHATQIMLPRTATCSNAVASSVALALNSLPNGTRLPIDKTCAIRHHFSRGGVAIKAILTNAIRHGPASQNRKPHADFRAYLTGKVAHVAMLNPFRARRLYALLDHISWQAPTAITNPGTEM